MEQKNKKYKNVGFHTCVKNSKKSKLFSFLQQNCVNKFKCFIFYPMTASIRLGVCEENSAMF